jgi:hypothetical protein
VVLVASAYLALPLMDQLTLRWFARDLNIRGLLVTTALSDSILDARGDAKRSRLQFLLDRAVQDERLVAIGLCSLDDVLVRSTPNYPRAMTCAAARAAAELPDPRALVAGGAAHVGFHPIRDDTDVVAHLVVLHDLSFIDRRSQDTRRYLIIFIAGLGLAIALITMVVAQLSWRGWINGVRGILRGEGLVRPWLSTPEMAPFAADIRAHFRDLEDEYRRSLGRRPNGIRRRLRALLRAQLSGDQVIVVSNREPYIHEKTADGVVVKRPASGLVTAVEPVMRACSGTWIAHGGGSADRTTVDRQDRVRVPPGKNEYMLRRIWLTEAGGAGLLLRFRQRGHVAAVPCGACAAGVPRVRLGALPRREPALRRCGGGRGAQRRPGGAGAGLPLRADAGDDPRQAAPATILTFWHIPWPNPESFGICPWRSEILEGMLGSTILGFHTRFHCKNFIETVDRISRRASNTSTRPSCTATRKPWSRVTRSRSNGRPTGGGGAWPSVAAVPRDGSEALRAGGR